MKRADVMPALTDAGAVMTDRHFVYTSGRHGSNYINLDLLLPDPTLISKMCVMLAEPFVGAFDTVAAPAVGGVVLAELTALAASRPAVPIYAVWADKTPEGFAFERAAFTSYVSGRRVLLVEDLLTTGGSLAAVVAQVVRHDGLAIGGSVICNRGRVTAASLSVPRLHSLVDVNFEAYDPESCPLCAEGRPIVEDVGHGADFRRAHPTYAGGYVSWRR